MGVPIMIDVVVPIMIGFGLGFGLQVWREHFKLHHWQEAFDEAGLDPDHFALRERGKDEALPWDHLDIGPAREYLWAERQRARDLIKTDYCVGKVCHVCGVPPSLCFAIKRDMGLLNTKQAGILEMDETGVTRGVKGVATDAQRKITVPSPGMVRAPRSSGAAR